MPPPVKPTGSLRWQLLTGELETRARWTAFCTRMVEWYAARPADPPPPAAGAPAAGGTVPIAPAFTPP